LSEAAHWQHVAAVEVAAAAHLCCALFLIFHAVNYTAVAATATTHNNNIVVFVVAPAVVYDVMQIVAASICLAVNNTNNCWQHCM